MWWWVIDDGIALREAKTLGPLMSHRVLAIDHLMINVASSQEAGTVFERLGFIATPKSSMPGLSNRLICFADTPHNKGVCNYIELMALEDAATAPPPMPDLLCTTGPVSTVMSVADASAVTERLSAGGLDVGPVLNLQRDWELPDGNVITPAFAVAIPALGQAPIYWNYCQHKTPQHYVRPEFTTHPNGVSSFDEVSIVVADRAAAVAHYMKHWQAVEDSGVLRLPAGPVLRLFTHQSIQDSQLGELIGGTDPGVKALRMRTGDIVSARRIVEAAGIATVDMARGFAVAAADAAGCALVFA